MSIYKPKNKDGSLYQKWYVEIIDHLGTVRRFSGFKNKGATKTLENNLEKLISYRASGRAFDPELTAWIETLNPRFIDRLCKIDLIGGETVAALKPLMISQRIKPKRSSKVTYNISGGHLADYRAHLESCERCRAHIVDTTNICAKFFDAQKLVFVSEITSRKIESYISTLRDQNISARRVNCVLGSIKAFCNWLIKEGCTNNNPADKVNKFNESADRRHIRRDLSEIELNELFEITRKSDIHHGITGKERLLVYWLGAGVGLRWNEIYTLTRCDFSLDSECPTVTIRAENEKAGRGETLPIPLSLASELQEYFLANPAKPQAKTFNKMWTDRGAEMLRIDLDAAGVKWQKNDIGAVVDFHSLRHTYGTLLAKSGVMPAQLKRLMRHSDVNLTMKYYTHLSMNHLGDEIKKLPNIEFDKSEDQAVSLCGKNTPIIRSLSDKLTNDSGLYGVLCGVNISKYGTFQHNSTKSNDMDQQVKKNRKCLYIKHFRHIKFGTPERIRTSDRKIRNLVLYPAELRAHF